jgi:hydroxymethylglutaryl-CoA lyase
MIEDEYQYPTNDEVEAGKVHVKICEVGPRDGLQNEATLLSTQEKITYIDLLSQSGLAMIETTSFVNPKAVPAMADAYEVMSGIRQEPGVTYVALVPNARGFARARESGVRAIAVFTAASESFVQHNIGMTIDESLAIFAPIVSEARAQGLFVRAYVSTAFACPYEGKIAIDEVLRVSERLCDFGIDELSIGDTIGVAYPQEVSELTQALQTRLPFERIAMHFHDTHRRAIANIAAAFAEGVRIFDSSSGGLGGCPYAPGASGNVATELVLRHFAQAGIETGVDVSVIEQATAYLFSRLNKTASE